MCLPIGYFLPLVPPAGLTLITRRAVVGSGVGGGLGVLFGVVGGGIRLAVFFVSTGE